MNCDLHERAVEIAGRFHRAESELIDILQKIDDQKLYFDMGFTSLFDYSVKALKLSEANAYNFITVARKSKSVPELKEAIAAGLINVSKARKITPVLTPENKNYWLTLAQELPKAKLEKEVAKNCPSQMVSERAQYVSEDRLKLTLGVSEEVMDLLKRVQDLESQRTGKAVSFEETLKVALELYVEKKDPVEKAKRNIKTVHQPVLGQVEIPFQRNSLAQRIKNQIHLRDQGQCTQKGCQNTKWLQIHHKIPISHGGTNDLQNLETLCSQHHRMKH